MMPQMDVTMDRVVDRVVPPWMRIAPEVGEALHDGRPVVAMESTLLAHGLPAPRNRQVAGELAEVVRSHGAVPAVVAVLDGVARVGLDPSGLDRVCAGELPKTSRRDLGAAIGLGGSGATTVASTAALASAAGIEVFATGGIGGVHRGARDSWDVSADLAVLAGTPVMVVCSGVKSILDIGATVESLETLGVPVVGFGTDAFPGFYRRDSGHPVAARVETPAEAAAVWRAHRAVTRQVGPPTGLLLTQPVPADAELDAALQDRLLAEGLALLAGRGITGKAVTPALLEHFHTASGGRSLDCNVALVLANAALAARVAGCL